MSISGCWLNNVPTHTVEYYSATKRSEAVPARIDLELTMLSEKPDTKGHTLRFTVHSITVWFYVACPERQTLRDRSGLVVARGWEVAAG